MAKYRKLSIIVDAVQWSGQKLEGVSPFIDETNPPSDHTAICAQCNNDWKDHGKIDTLEGIMIVCPGDWVITGIKGELYACKPDVFEKTYEKVNTHDYLEDIKIGNLGMYYGGEIVTISNLDNKAPPGYQKYTIIESPEQARKLAQWLTEWADIVEK
jgi:hypothetical protein